MDQPDLKNINQLEAKLKVLEKYWSPFALTYDPLKAGSIDGTDCEPHDKAIIRAQNANYRPSPKAKGKPECTIFVARLDHRTKESDLLKVYRAHCRPANTPSLAMEEVMSKHFDAYGRIINCRIVEDIVTGQSKGYGFIEYETERAAARAYRIAHKTWLDGRMLFVDMECERLLHGWVPRRLGGGFNGKKESGQLRFGGRDRPFKKPIGLLSSSEILHTYDEKFSKTDDKYLRSKSDSHNSSHSPRCE